MTTYTPEQVADWKRRARWVEELLVELDAVEVAAFPDLPDANPETWSWLASLQLAKTEGLPLYCDDAWVRRLAASLDVRSFGSVDLLGVLTATGKITGPRYMSAMRALRMNRAVCIPISASELVDLASNENWSGGIAALQIAQPGYWANAEAGHIYESLLTLATRNNSGALPTWLQAGIYGAARRPGVSASEICARFLASAVARYAQPAIVPGLVAAARAVARRLGTEDPLPAFSIALRDLLVSRLGNRDAIVSVTALTAQLDPDEANKIKLPFFMPKFSA